MVGDGRRWRVPPPESEVWPEQCRGKRWRPCHAQRFMGRCQLCAYSCPLPKLHQLLDAYFGVGRMILCVNHPQDPGVLHEVLPTGRCRNFKPMPWKTPRRQRERDLRRPSASASGPGVRQIPLGRGLFATVDARDYKKLCQYKWYAIRGVSTVYAMCRINGRTVYMHRMIMRPRRGYVVDHKDGNGLNNRRCNLRECTARQNHANRGPRGGSSKFVGVFRVGKKWEARLVYRGKYHGLGRFDDPVAAAKARDRKAVEVNGPYAYLNFPEDWRFDKNGVGHPVRRHNAPPTAVRQVRPVRVPRDKR